MNLMELDALIYEVIVDANGEDEQLWDTGVKKAKFSTIEPRRSSPEDRVSHSKWSSCFRWTTPKIRMAIRQNA